MNKRYWEYKKEDFNGLNTKDMTLTEIATFLNCKEGKARQVLHCVGLDFKREIKERNSKKFELDIELFLQQYKIKSVSKIAVENGVSIKEVKLYMQKNNINVCRKKTLYCKRIATIYDHILERCYKDNSSSYKYYGARGIKVCEEWKNSRQAFYKWAYSNGYKENLTIDRIDVNKDYCPENCRWVTMEEQANNKSNSKYIEYKGLRLTRTQWEKKLGFKRGLLKDRIDRYGWDIERALETPVKN